MASARRTRFLLYIAALVLTLVNLAPIVWIALTAFKTRVQIYQIPPIWIPDFTYLDNFAAVIQGYWPFLLNSVVITLCSTALCLLIAIPCAFGLTLFTFKGREDLKMWVLSNRMMPPIAAAVPLYLAMRGVGLLDTWTGMILIYTGFNLPFAIWMAMSFFRSAPVEVLEAARIDGCNWLQVLVKVMVPMAAGGLMTVAVFVFLFAWNELLIALFLTNRNARTFPVILTSFSGQAQTVWEQMAAASIIQLVPPVILTFFVQRHIVAGMTMGAVK
ncbi:carbohydrate ABC transporter permease [Geminicoccus flavidas]|uniref:carbohydrate ABC transporter permease n=1 Tax=Geminicoccus flavidas TaxID=2506407 RepID=UPI00135933F8|nr:carbohydrate ABC transporter permease [Geminicoccus flavidas]